MLQEMLDKLQSDWNFTPEQMDDIRNAMAEYAAWCVFIAT